MIDLFDKRSDKDKLFDWMKLRRWTKTSDVIKWGTLNYSNRAERNARALSLEGKVRRMTEQEKIDNFLQFSKEEVWVVNA